MVQKNAARSSIVKEKIINTNLEKYGTKYTLQADTVREKIKNTCMTLYGAPCALASSSFQKYRRSRFVANKLMFDSLPELALYLYASDHHEKIIRLPTTFKFIFNNEEHTYYPDFLYKEKIIEIKGDHFFKEDGTMCNPFDHTQDELYEAKHQCMIANNVEIWTCEKYNKYLDYFNKNYSVDNFIYDE